MIPEQADIWLLVAYVFILGGTVIQYTRGKLPFRRTVLPISMSFTWLSYALLQVQDGLVPTGSTLSYALHGVALVLLFVGSYGLYWWWRHDDDGEDRNSGDVEVAVRR